MKKLILVLLFFSFWNIESISANWYGNHPVAFSNPGGAVLVGAGWPNRGTLCNGDGDPAGWNHATLWAAAVANDNNSVTLIPETDAEFTVSATGNMRCLYWDSYTPIVNTLTYTNAWTNNTNQVINFSFTDAGGSKLWRYTLQQRIANDNPTFSTWGAWQNVIWHTNQLIPGSTNTFSGNYNLVAVNNRAYQFRILVEDVATNVSAWTTPARTIRVDTQAPLASDIGSSSPGSGATILATTTQNISLTVWINGGAPITLIRWYFENHASSTWGYISSPFTTSGATFSHVFNIRDVDLQRLWTWERPYSLKITHVCDQATNCTTVNDNSSNTVWIKNYSYNVYANTLSPVTSILSNPLTNAWNIADGSADIVRVSLRDSLGNSIIPTTGAMTRNISFETTLNNNLRLNQYDLTTSSGAIFVNAVSSIWEAAIGVSTKSYWNKPSTSTGIYDLPYYVFAPTSNASSFLPGSATVTNITFSSTGIWPALDSIISGSSFSIVARPLFTTSMTGSIRLQWFIEGVTQSGSITLAKANATVTSWENLYFEFWNYNTGTSLNEANPRYTLSINGSSNIREGVGPSNPSSTSIASVPLIPAATRTISTRMLLQSGSVSTFTNSYLATILEYQVWGKNVVYPYDILWKLSYHGAAGNSNSFQSWIKIIGNTSSQNTQELTTNQFSQDVQIIGKIEKSLARKDIQENVYEVIRNIIPKSSGTTNLASWDLQPIVWSNGTRWSVFYGSGAIYFATWVTLSGAGNIEGNKTLVVEGNVYITGNIRDTDNDAMLWIIALSKNGVGWNIYIDPAVTDIHAVLYADKSVLSYDGTKEFDGGNSSEVELRNQLYIKGSIFSENTIGGSRKTPVACPYFINVTCTQNIAQKYDMNYLRRYFIYDSSGNGTIQPTVDLPANGGSRSIWGAVWSGYEEYPVIIDYNTRIQQTPPPFFWSK